MFVLENGEIMINELAPRPHNSGHYSIEACNISQFASTYSCCLWMAIKRTKTLDTNSDGEYIRSACNSC